MKKPESRILTTRHSTDLHRYITAGILSSGYPDFFKLAIQSYYADLLRAAQFIVEPADATEVVQEVFCRAWKFRRSFGGQSNYYTWLYRIMLNQAKNRYQYQHNPKNMCSHTTLSISTPAGAAIPLYTNNPSPPEHLDRRYAILQVRSAVRQLPEKLRIVVYLHYFAGMRYHMIARQLNCSIGTVKSRLNRSRQILRSLLYSCRKISRSIG